MRRRPISRLRRTIVEANQQLGGNSSWLADSFETWMDALQIIIKNEKRSFNNASLLKLRFSCYSFIFIAIKILL